MTDMNPLTELLDKNRAWSDRISQEDPEFFARLSKQQNPEFLWIGCSDSRVPANQIIDMAPGEVFVHRNVANVVVHTDLNCLSTIQFAVDVLKVRHILVVGHYGCGGVLASLTQARLGLVDNWIRHVTDVADKHGQCLHDVRTLPLQHARLCELNVLEQVVHVARTTVVQDAWSRGQDLTVHGWVYSLRDGLVHDLVMDIGASDQLDSRYATALAKIQADRQER